MKMSAENLYALLPAIYRIRDAEAGYPLRELIGVIAEQAAVVEENIEQLYDDQFIETCADWVAPYLGGLIGYRPLHGISAAIASPRAEVANTIGYRRRLGTASVLEQLARDVTGWPARVVEYVFLVATTQRMNHIRPRHHIAPDLRDGAGLERIGTGFDPFSRMAELRAIGRADGRYNLPNIGIHLWRLQAQPRGARIPQPAYRVDDRRWLFSPLGAPLPLFTKPATPDGPVGPLNVPIPLTRRALHADLTGAAPPRAIYGLAGGDGPLQSLLVAIDDLPLTAAEVAACDLSDVLGGWAHMPAAGGRIGIDPVLGRIALPPGREGRVDVAYHQGFAAEIGGGAYPRAAAFAMPVPERPLLRVPDDQPTVQAALAALPVAGGIIEITDHGRHDAPAGIALGPGAALELRAADECFPHLLLTADLEIRGGQDAAVTLDGLLVSGGALSVPTDAGNALRRLVLRHCTLVPGQALDAAGNPAAPGAPALLAALPGLALEASHCIMGPLRVAADAEARVAASIIDAAAALPLDSTECVAYAAPDGSGFGGALTLLRVTVFGQLAATHFDLVSDSLLLARAAAGQTAAPVRAERRQLGCMRYSFVPPGALVPRRFRCQPQLAIDQAIAAREARPGPKPDAAERAAIARREALRVVPGFVARRFGRPAYAQLRATVPAEVLAGAEDEGEMGAFHLNAGPQRQGNLRIRLEEYLRVSLDAGAFLEN
jgi:hypothetical protein